MSLDSIIVNRHQRQSDLFALKLDLPVLAVLVVSKFRLHHCPRQSELVNIV